MQQSDLIYKAQVEKAGYEVLEFLFYLRNADMLTQEEEAAIIYDFSLDLSKKYSVMPTDVLKFVHVELKRIANDAGLKL